MSDRPTRAADHDPIAHRLVVALDGLPVPAGPSGLRAASPHSIVKDSRVLLLAALVLVLVTVVSSPQFQNAAGELTRYIQRVLFGPGWSGYYLDLNATDASGKPATRVMFATGESGVLPTDVIGRFAEHGPWSPDEELLTICNDAKIYVADRRGALREIADVGTGFIVDRCGWIWNDRVFAILNTSTGIATASPAGGGRAGSTSFATIDLRTGHVDIRELQRPLTGRAFVTISPDGRWLPMTRTLGGCGVLASLYDLTTEQVVDVVDAQGRPASALPFFLNDGQLFVTQCDRAAGTVQVYVGAPGARPTLITSVPMGQSQPLVSVDRRREEIFVVTGSPAATQSVSVYDLRGRVIRTIELPALASSGTLDSIGFSGSGRFLTFGVSEARAGEITARVGVIDLSTGQVTYLCDMGCSRLAIR